MLEVAELKDVKVKELDSNPLARYLLIVPKEWNTQTIEIFQKNLTEAHLNVLIMREDFGKLYKIVGGDLETC